MPEPFGRRVRQIRKALGLSQEDVTGISQPFLSKIESGKEVASADVVDKLASAFGRDGLMLVRGTDREGNYTAQRLRPEQRQALAFEERLTNALNLQLLFLQYSRVFELFDVLYGQAAFVVNSPNWLEARYIDLRERCKKCMHDLKHVFPDIDGVIYFPDHIEPEGDMDDLVLGGWEFEGAEVKKSLRKLQEEMYAYRDLYSAESRAILEKNLNIKIIDEEIVMLREAQKRAQAAFMKRMERATNNPVLPNFTQSHETSKSRNETNSTSPKSRPEE